MRSHAFSRARRLRRRSEFQRAFSTGTRVQGKYLTLLLSRNRVGTPRLGVVASRKLGDAVRRNRAKRLIREVFRLTIPPSSNDGVDVVVIPRREFFDSSLRALEQDFRSAFRRCVSRLSSHAG